MSTSLGEMLYKVNAKGIDVFRSDSGVDDLAKESRVQFADQTLRALSTNEKKEDESEEEEKVGDIVRFGQNNYFIVDIFEKEIMELGDKVDLNFKRFNKFEVVDGDAPSDHHFYNYRCCYSSCCYFCGGNSVESEWRTLKMELASKEKKVAGSKGVSFFVRTYSDRKELMRVAVTVNHNLFFFDVKFPTEFPYQAPSFFHYPYGTQKSLRHKFPYSFLDVFLHIEEIVMMNTTNNRSSHQMVEMLRRPLMGFEDFVKGYFREKGALILGNMMDKMDLEKEKDKNMFLRTYIAFEDNKAYCEHLLSSDLKEELKSFKEKEYTLGVDIQKTCRYQTFWSKFLHL